MNLRILGGALRHALSETGLLSRATSPVVRASETAAPSLRGLPLRRLIHLAGTPRMRHPPRALRHDPSEAVARQLIQGGLWALKGGPCLPPLPSPIASKIWTRHIGSLWEYIFQAVHLPRDGTIVEIAPGSVPKIANGLARYGFRGNVYLVEPEPRSLLDALRGYRTHLVHSKIHPLQGTLGEAISELPQRPDIVAANHPLDDMIVGSAAGPSTLMEHFQDHYVKGPEESRFVWQILESDPLRLRRAKQAVLNEWRELVCKKEPRVVAISQYESFFFRTHGIPEPDRHALELLTRMKQDWGDTPPEITEALDRLGADGTRWLVTVPRRAPIFSPLED